MGENYAFFLSGMPGEVSKSWLQALSGGQQTMQFAGALPETKPLATSVSYQLDVPDGTNPSVCVHDGRLLVMVRTPAANVLGELAGRKVQGQRVVSGAYSVSTREMNPCRLYSLAGCLGAVACYADYSVTGTPHAQIALLQLSGASVTGLVVLASKRYEKNWMPCVDGDRLRLVYSTDPLAVLDTPYAVGDALPTGGVLRGSSQLIPYKEGWLAVVHQTHLLKDAGGSPPPVYLHRFVQFDKALTAARAGRPWHLQKQGVEIVAGLAFWQGKFIISYGTDDVLSTRAAWIAGVDVNVVDEMLAPL